MQGVHKLLIVDDKENIRIAVAQRLGTMGYECRKAASGMEVLELLGKEEFNLVLTDLRMPEMDGLALHRVIKEQYPDLPVLMFTGDGSMEAANDFLGRGGARYMEKPINFELLNTYISYEIRMAELQKKRKEAEEELTKNFGSMETIRSLCSQMETQTGRITSAASQFPSGIYQHLKQTIEGATGDIQRDLATIMKTIDTKKPRND